MQPSLAGGEVVFGDDRFVMHMREVTLQAGDLLPQPALCGRHQLPIAFIPEFVTMSERSNDAPAGGLDRVFRHQIGVERWEFPMPVHDLSFIVIHGVHMAPDEKPSHKWLRQPSGLGSLWIGLH